MDDEEKKDEEKVEEEEEEEYFTNENIQKIMKNMKMTMRMIMSNYEIKFMLLDNFFIHFFSNYDIKFILYLDYCNQYLIFILFYIYIIVHLQMSPLDRVHGKRKKKLSTFRSKKTRATTTIITNLPLPLTTMAPQMLHSPSSTTVIPSSSPLTPLSSTMPSLFHPIPPYLPTMISRAFTTQPSYSDSILPSIPATFTTPLSSSIMPPSFPTYPSLYFQYPNTMPHTPSPTYSPFSSHTMVSLGQSPSVQHMHTSATITSSQEDLHTQTSERTTLILSSYG